MGAVAGTSTVLVHAINTAGRASALLSLGTRLPPPDISAGYAPVGGGPWPNFYAYNETIALEVTRTLALILTLILTQIVILTLSPLPLP